MSHRQQVVNDFEPIGLRRIVDGCDVTDLGVLGGGVVLQEGENGNDTLGWYVDGKFVFPDREPAERQRKFD